MKLLKGISLFVFYPMLLLTLGFYAGVRGAQYFQQDRPEGASVPGGTRMNAIQAPAGQTYGAAESTPAAGEGSVGGASSDAGEGDEEAAEVLFSAETLCVDTEYVVEEADILNHTVVELAQRLPGKYVGMNREQFVQAMSTYSMAPPLSELQRGFVGLEVQAFSRERVVVRMNYKFLQPSGSFYLAVYDNEVVVYLEDRETVYIETGIELDSLPAQLQREIMGMLWVEDEETLYDILQNYSS